MLWLHFFVPHSLSSKGDINKYNPEPESLFFACSGRIKKSAESEDLII